MAEHLLMVRWIVRLVTHGAISCFSQCSTSGITKAVVCAHTHKRIKKKGKKMTLTFGSFSI